MKASGRMTLRLLAGGFVFLCLSAVPSFAQQGRRLSDAIRDGKPFIIDFQKIQSDSIANARYSGTYDKLNDVWNVSGPVKGGASKTDSGGCGTNAAHRTMAPPCPVPQEHMIDIWGGTWHFDDTGKIYENGAVIGFIQLAPATPSSEPPPPSSKGGTAIAILTLAALAGVSAIWSKRS
jgi:hypothetical protein